MNGILICYSYPQIFEVFDPFKVFIAYCCVGIVSYRVVLPPIKNTVGICKQITFLALQLISIATTASPLLPVLFIKGLGVIICHVFPM